MTIDTSETSRRLREIAAASIVLLKNDSSVLPFQKDKSVGFYQPNLNTRKLLTNFRLPSLAQMRKLQLILVAVVQAYTHITPSPLLTASHLMQEERSCILPVARLLKSFLRSPT
jgi:beta-glucosidase-like glycosyl hydrolase